MQGKLKTSSAWQDIFPTWRDEDVLNRVRYDLLETWHKWRCSSLLFGQSDSTFMSFHCPNLKNVMFQQDFFISKESKEMNCFKIMVDNVERPDLCRSHLLRGDCRQLDGSASCETRHLGFVARYGSTCGNLSCRCKNHDNDDICEVTIMVASD